MNLIDLGLAAQLLVAVLLLATLESAPAPAPADPPQAPGDPVPPIPAAAPPSWSAEADLHAQRILRLEQRAAACSAPIA